MSTEPRLIHPTLSCHNRPQNCHGPVTQALLSCHLRALVSTAGLITTHNSMKTLLSLAAVSILTLSACNDDHQSEKPQVSPLQTTLVGRYHDNPTFTEGMAEITAYHSLSQSIFIINAEESLIDTVSIANLDTEALANPLSASNLTKTASIDVSTDIKSIGGINSVAVHDNLLAVAVEHDDKQASGFIAFYELDNQGKATFIKSVPAGSLPDNVVFTKDGKYALSANEGEPSKDYKHDPEGSITLVSIKQGQPDTVKQLSFSAFNQGGSKAGQLDLDVRISGPNATVAQDLEPEYIAVSEDSTKAYVSLQENNAYAIVDIANADITSVKAFGYKDHGKAGNGLDASNKDAAINIETYAHLRGLYMPDTVQAYSVKGINYLVTANEGDGRDYSIKDFGTEADCTQAGGIDYDEGECLFWVDESRVGKLDLDTTVFDTDIQDNTKLGRLKTLVTEGDANGDGKHEAIYSMGARSFSIFEADTGKLVFDSGDDFERITAGALGTAGFNATNDENGFDDRSDDKGPEPEALAIGEVNGQTYAFIGLERTGGIMVYNITNPYNVSFEHYTINRDLTVDIKSAHTIAGDLGPEGMSFVKASDSPTQKALLIVGNEVSGSTTVYQLD